VGGLLLNKHRIVVEEVVEGGEMLSIAVRKEENADGDLYLSMYHNQNLFSNMAVHNGKNSISPFFPGFQGIVATERA